MACPGTPKCSCTALGSVVPLPLVAPGAVLAAWFHNAAACIAGWKAVCCRPPTGLIIWVRWAHGLLLVAPGEVLAVRAMSQQLFCALWSFSLVPTLQPRNLCVLILCCLE